MCVLPAGLGPQGGGGGGRGRVLLGHLCLFVKEIITPAISVLGSPPSLPSLLPPVPLLSGGEWSPCAGGLISSQEASLSSSIRAECTLSPSSSSSAPFPFIFCFCQLTWVEQKDEQSLTFLLLRCRLCPVPQILTNFKLC